VVTREPGRSMRLGLVTTARGVVGGAGLGCLCVSTSSAHCALCKEQRPVKPPTPASKSE
jgi:hypothetical protein